MAEEKKMQKYRCRPCGFIYDPAVGIPDYGIKPGIAFEDLPENWVCPKCAATKWMFEKVED